MPRRAKVRWSADRRCWWANVGPRDPKGRATERYAPQSIGPADEPAAWAWMAAEQAASALPPIRVEAWTLGRLTEEYLRWCESRLDLSPTAKDHLSRSQYNNLTRHLGIALGWSDPAPAATLDHGRMDDLVRHLERVPYAAVYIGHVCSAVVACLNWSVRSKLIDRNPADKYRPPAVPRSPERYATRKEAADWLRWYWRRVPKDDGRWGVNRSEVLLQRCLIHSGARPKELATLRWADLKWNAWRTKGQGGEPGPRGAKGVLDPGRWKSGGKTGQDRTIYLAPPLQRALRREHKRSPDPSGRGPVFYHRGRRGREDPSPWPDGTSLSKKIARVRGELVAAIPAARAIVAGALHGPPSIRDRWLAATAITDEGENRIVNYRWRHTAASDLIMRGLDVATGAKLLGTSADMLSKTYAHILDAHLADAAGGRAKRG